MSRRQRLLGFGAALSAIVLLLTGCGGGSSASSGSREIAFARFDSEGAGGIVAMNADGSGQTMLTENKGEGGDADPSWSPDGSRIAFVRDGAESGDIFVMNADGSGQTKLTDGPAQDLSPTWSPDGKRIAFERSENGDELFIMNADGSGERRLGVDAHVEDPAWSPDGTKIAFGGNEIYVVNVDGSELTNLTNTDVEAGDENEPAWSPDGKRIAFASD